MPSDDQIASLARAVAGLYATLGGQPAPDAMRARLGAEDALNVMHLAGQDTAPVAARWAGATPARPAAQQQRRQAHIFETDPMHHPAVVAAQIRGGDVRAALRTVAADMSNPPRAQRAAMALDFLAADRMSVADAVDAASAELQRAKVNAERGGMPVPAGISAGEDGRPRQSSRVHMDVTPLASERGGADYGV